MTYRIVEIEAPSRVTAKYSVLIIYTGGTLGMTHDELGTLRPFDFEKIIEEMPVLKSLDLRLTVISFPQPIDSSNIMINHWNQLAQIIERYYHQHDGFVVLHGTDTMAYSASALSFMLEGLCKPVVFTGAQLPFGAARSDANQNLVAALQIASAHHQQEPVIQEVAIYFDYFLFRGNRCKKVESVHFDAFESENYPPLAEAGISIDFDFNALYRPLTDQPFKAYQIAPTQIALIKLFPGYNDTVMAHTLETPGLQAVLLETFGSGNAPTSQEFKTMLKKAIDQGVIVYNVSQCNGGRVLQGRYSTSKHLLDMGVISGADITTEAALAKMQFLLSTAPNSQQILAYLSTPLRGEMA